MRWKNNQRVERQTAGEDKDETCPTSERMCGFLHQRRRLGGGGVRRRQSWVRGIVRANDGAVGAVSAGFGRRFGRFIGAIGAVSVPLSAGFGASGGGLRGLVGARASVQANWPCQAHQASAVLFQLRVG